MSACSSKTTASGPPRMGRRASDAGRLVLVVSALCLCLPIFVGCASLGSISRSDDAASNREVRPELPVDYDVLVGEMALMDGDFEAARTALTRAAAKDPESSYLELRLSRIAAQLDDLEGAIHHASRAVALDPTNLDARVLLGGFYRIARDPEGAERALLDEQGQPINETAALLMYQIYLESDRLEDALAIAERLVASRPEVLGGYMALATTYERMGRLDAAERILRQALVVHPDRFVLYSRLARLKRAEGDLLGEVAIYREVLTRHPHHRGTLMSLGEALVNANDLDAALAVYAEIVEHHPDDMKSLRRYASLEYAAGNTERAAELLRSGLASHPEQYEMSFSLGQVLRGAGKTDEALATFRSISAESPAYIEARTQVIAILESLEDYEGALVELDGLRQIEPNRALDFHAAGLHLRTGDFDGGKAILDAMMAETPDDTEVLYQLGVFYGMAKQVDLAIATMMRVLEIDPNNAHALNYVGYTWAERGENLDQAEEFILRAREQRPNDGFIADSLGWVWYMRGRALHNTTQHEAANEFFIRARDQLTLAAELTGGDPVVSEHLGDVYFTLDQKERAYEYYLEAVEMEPRPDEQPHLLDKIDTLRQELGE